MELHRRGRDFEDDTTLALKGDKSTLLWSLAGNAADVKRSEERSTLVDAIKTAREAGASISELVLQTGMPRQNVDFLLYKLVHETNQAVHRVQRGLYVHSAFLSAWEQAQRIDAKRPERKTPHPSSAPTREANKRSNLSDLRGGGRTDNQDGQTGVAQPQVIPFPTQNAQNTKMPPSSGTEVVIQEAPATLQILSDNLHGGIGAKNVASDTEAECWDL